MAMPASFKLFAIDRSRWDDVARPMATTELIWCLAAVVGLAIAVALLIQLLAWRDRRRDNCRPWLLFWSLCHVHRLSWRDRWLLWKAARRERLQNPSRMFVEAERFDAENLGPRLAAHPRLAAVRLQLFGPSGQRAARSELPLAELSATAPDVGIPSPLPPLQPRPTLDW